jgi:hypothetical protein
MNNINTRKWSTPITIASGVFVALSGVLMFFGVHNPIELAHEWIGLAFAAAILLHVLNHWGAFSNYFTQRRSLGIVALVTVVTASLIFTSLNGESGSPVRAMIHSYVSSPLTEVAPLLNKRADEVAAQLTAAGYSVDDPKMSINQIAQANGADSKALMGALFN